MFLSPSAKSLVTEIFNGQAPTAKVRDEEFTYAREHGSAFNKIFTWKWAIPLQDQNHEFREARILLQRAKYDWETDDDFPDHLKLRCLLTMNDFVDHEQKFLALLQAVVINIKAHHIFWKKTELPSTLKDYSDLYTKTDPDLKMEWRNDVEFAKQRVMGVNPTKIEQLNKEKFHELVTEFPGKNKIGEWVPGRFYVVDYRQTFKGVEIPNITKDSTMPESVALFEVMEGMLKPVGIMHDSDWFTPDEEWVWLYAKMWFCMIDGQYHEYVAHLVRTHLVAEVFAVSIFRNLPKIHPLYQLLRPHFAGTFVINNIARTRLVPDLLAHYMACGNSKNGGVKLIKDGFAEWTFHVANPVKDMMDRGLEDLAPQFPHIQQIKALFEAQGEYLKTFVETWYKSDKDVEGDEEIQNLIKEMRKHFGESETAVPDRKTIPELVEFLNVIIWTVSSQHSIVNFLQQRYISFVPNMPLTFRDGAPLPRRTSIKSITERDIVNALPTPQDCFQQVLITSILSSHPSTEDSLFEFSRTALFQGAPTDKAQAKLETSFSTFKKAMQRISNSTRSSYNVLDPKFIPMSIEI